MSQRLLDLAPTRWGVLLFALSFAIRGGALLRVPRAEILYGVVTPQGLLSGEECINVAWSLASRGEFADPYSARTGPTAHCPPIYPAVTAVIFRVFGPGLAGGVVRNLVNIAGHSLLIAVLPWAAGALQLPTAGGAVAGLAAALYPQFRSTEVFRGRDEWLAGLLLLWLTVFAFRRMSDGPCDAASGLLYGAAWGVLVHVLPPTIVVLPAHAVLLRRASRRNLRWAAAASAALLLVFIPWTLRNKVVLGHWVFVRSNAGLELYLSNQSAAAPTLHANMRKGWYGNVHPSWNPAVARQLREAGEVAFHSRLGAEAKAWALQHPGKFARLTLWRAIHFWCDVPSKPATSLVRTMWSALGVAGLVVLWRRRYRLQAIMLAALLAAYPLTYYLVQYSIRYVAPVSFALLLPAGFAIVAAWEKLRGGAAVRA